MFVRRFPSLLRSLRLFSTSSLDNERQVLQSLSDSLLSAIKSREKISFEECVILAGQRSSLGLAFDESIYESLLSSSMHFKLWEVADSLASRMDRELIPRTRALSELRVQLFCEQGRIREMIEELKLAYKLGHRFSFSIISTAFKSSQKDEEISQILHSSNFTPISDPFASFLLYLHSWSPHLSSHDLELVALYYSQCSKEDSKLGFQVLQFGLTSNSFSDLSLDGVSSILTFVLRYLTFHVPEWKQQPIIRLKKSVEGTWPYLLSEEASLVKSLDAIVSVSMSSVDVHIDASLKSGSARKELTQVFGKYTEFLLKTGGLSRSVNVPEKLAQIPSPYIYSLVLQACYNCHQYHFMSDLFERMVFVDKLTPSEEIMQLFLSAACKHGLLEETNTILKYMQVFKHSLSNYSFTILLEGRLRIGDIVGVENLLSQMALENIKPTSYTHGLLARGYTWLLGPVASLTYLKKNIKAMKRDEIQRTLFFMMNDLVQLLTLLMEPRLNGHSSAHPHPHLDSIIPSRRSHSERHLRIPDFLGDEASSLHLVKKSPSPSPKSNADQVKSMENVRMESMLKLVNDTNDKQGTFMSDSLFSLAFCLCLWSKHGFTQSYPPKTLELYQKVKKEANRMKSLPSSPSLSPDASLSTILKVLSVDLLSHGTGNGSGNIQESVIEQVLGKELV
jgi:hypothetical protein